MKVRCSRSAWVLTAGMVLATWGIPESASADPPAAAILKNANAALADTQSLAYNATVTIQGGPEVPPAPLHTEVMLKRAPDEKGVGWKLYIAETDPNGAIPDGGSNVYIAFDGFAARSIKRADKAVYEKQATDAAVLESFLQLQGARDVVVWPLLNAATIQDAADPKDSGMSLPRDVDGHKCDVVWVKSGEQTTTYYLSADDHLPRKIEIAGAVAPKAADPAGAAAKGDKKSTATADPKDRIVRTVILTNIKRNVPINEGTFIVDIPDEFMVRAVKDPAAPAKGSEAEKGSDPPLAGKDGEKKPRQKVQTPGLLTPGSPAPDWTLKNPDGKEVKLADFRGKVVVLDFWGSWCPPCRAALPSMEKIHQKYKGKGVVVLGMNFEQDADADPKKFMADNGITYGLVLHSETIADRYKVPGWPTFYVIDPHGDIVWGSVGFSKAAAEEHETTMSEAIDEALKAGL